MKYLLSLILSCMLLCGCGQNDSSYEPVPTAEPVVEAISEQKEFSGDAEIRPLNLQQVQGLRIFHGDILLFSGEESTTLTLLDADTLELRGSFPLNFPLNPEDPSLVFHSSNRLSFYDPQRKETVVLNSSLAELYSLPVSEALSGSPILSEDETILFYCTASHLRAWHLETGIHRCVKEMAFPCQTLTGLHMDGTILQCQISDNNEIQTVFIRSEDGQQLCSRTGTFSLTTDKTRYFAKIPAGSYTVPVFGTDPSLPLMLFPEDPSAQVFFLREQLSAVLATAGTGGLRLDYCQLSTGRITHQLMLKPNLIPLTAASLNETCVCILIRDTHTGKDFLVLWNVGTEPLEKTACSVLAYRTARDPDLSGLARCMEQADRLGKQYGIRIHLWEDAVANTPTEHPPEAEHLVPIIQRELELLEQYLNRFPESVLRETASHFESVNLCLVRSLPDSGCADFLQEKHAYLVLPAGSPQVLSHQLFHLMEIHIFSQSGVFDRWDTLNPAGFRYDYDYATNARRDSGVYLFEDSRCFVDTFSMSYPKEDRARLLEYAMAPGNEALFRPPMMQKKLRQLCRGIREAYSLQKQNDPFLWEQYLE